MIRISVTPKPEEMFMRKHRRFGWWRHILLIAAVSIQALLASAAGSTQRANVSADALKALIPEGYKVEKTIVCEPEKGVQQEQVVALSDIDDSDIPGRPVILLLVAGGTRKMV